MNRTRILVLLSALLVSAAALADTGFKPKAAGGGGGGGAVNSVNGSSGLACSPSSGDVVCSGSAFLQSSNNLSDVGSATTARLSLGITPVGTFTPTATRIPFGGATTNTLVDSTKLTWNDTTASEALTITGSGTVGPLLNFVSTTAPNSSGPLLGFKAWANTTTPIGLVLFEAPTTGHFVAFDIFQSAPNAIDFFSLHGVNAGGIDPFIAFVQLKDVMLGHDSALATNATQGFVWLPTMAGQPTSAPAFDGDLAKAVDRKAIVLDTTDNAFMSYYGGSWHNLSGITQLTGDVTAGPGTGSVVATISGLSLSKLALQADQTILCNNSGSSSAPSACTTSTISTMLGLAPIATSGSANDLSTGTLPAGRAPAFSGDVTSSAGSLTTTLANVPNDVTMAGDILATASAAPATPAAGKARIYVDSTAKTLSLKNDAGVVSHGVQSKGSVSHNFLTAIADNGTVSAAQPAASDLTGLAAVATSGSAADLSTGTLPAGRLPALTGDVTTTAGSTTTALGNIPNDTTAAGDVLVTATAAPATPASGKARVYVDSTSKALASKNDAGTVSHTVQTKASVSHNFLTAVADDGTVSAAQPAASDVSGLAAVATSGSATDLTTGTLGTGRLPAFSGGDVTSSAGSATLTLGNIPNDTTAAGDILHTAVAAPATPATGKARVYVDSTSKALASKNDAGTVSHTVQSKSSVSHNFLTAVADDGTVSAAQPAYADISGLGTAAQNNVSAFVQRLTTSTVTTLAAINVSGVYNNGDIALVTGTGGTFVLQAAAGTANSTNLIATNDDASRQWIDVSVLTGATKIYVSGSINLTTTSTNVIVPAITGKTAVLVRYYIVNTSTVGTLSGAATFEMGDGSSSANWVAATTNGTDSTQFARGNGGFVATQPASSPSSTSIASGNNIQFQVTSGATGSSLTFTVKVYVVAAYI